METALLCPSSNQSSPLSLESDCVSWTENAVLWVYPHSFPPSFSSASSLWRSKESLPSEDVAWENQSLARKPAAFPDAEAKRVGDDSTRWIVVEVDMRDR